VEDSLKLCPLIPNPFHILEQNLLAAAIIKFRGPSIGVTRDPLSGFKRAVVLQKIGDPGRPERVRRIVSWQSRFFESSFKHVRGISAHERPA
jgi:hypothetical protein